MSQQRPQSFTKHTWECIGTLFSLGNRICNLALTFLFSFIMRGLKCRRVRVGSAAQWCPQGSSGLGSRNYSNPPAGARPHLSASAGGREEEASWPHMWRDSLCSGGAVFPRSSWQRRLGWSKLTGLPGTGHEGSRQSEFPALSPLSWAAGLPERNQRDALSPVLQAAPPAPSEASRIPCTALRAGELW